ncbi:CHAT domain-containing protein [Ilyonectria destructans]|nr:CHAT domain-containing protein [Ilyonectria destructans]
MAAMARSDIDEFTKLSESSDEEIKVGESTGVHKRSSAGFDDDTPMRDDYDGDGGSDGSWEDVSDQEDMVELIKQALETVLEGDPEQVELLVVLGKALFDRYYMTRAIADLEEAIQIARQVINRMPVDHPEQSGYLNDLGIRLGERYSRSGSAADIEEAVRIMRQVANPLLSGDLEPAGVLHNLGRLFNYKYSRTGALADLEEAILVTGNAVETTPEDHPEWVARVDSLGQQLGDRYLATGIVCDLQESIRLAKRALEAAPEEHLDYPGLLSNLGARLGDEYSRRGVAAELGELEEAIQYIRKAEEMLSFDHPGQAMVLNNLGNHLGKRYLRTDSMADLEEAVQVLRQAVDLTPDDDTDRAISLNSLGLQLGQRYLRTGAVADLDEAIQDVQQAIDMTPEQNPNWLAYINNLGAQLGDRYGRIGARADLEEAIRILGRAIDVAPEGYPNSGALLTHLGLQLSCRYSISKDEVDLDAGIQMTRKGLEMTTENHSDRVAQLDMLAILLGQRYSETRATSDLEEAIKVARQAVQAAPQGGPYRARVLNNLGDDLGNLYLRTKKMADLEEAISYLRQAVEIMPQDYPDRSALLGNLGDQLDSLYARTGAIKDREDAIANYQEALNQTNSYTLSRIWAGRGILRCASDWQHAYEAASLAVSLVPRLSLRSLQNSDRQHALSQVVGLASDAAAVALQAGQTPLVALGLLEQGRGVLGTSLEEVRTDILSLRGRDSKLADQFVRLRDELETAVSQNPQLVGGKLESPWKAQASRRYEAGKEFDKLVAKIQTLPGFEDFLLPPSERDLKSAAQWGPIILINVSKYRCDALLLEPHQIQALPLTQLSIEEIEARAQRGDLSSYEVLEWLWDLVTRPVLDALGFTNPPSSDGNWPRVWWIPTGPLSKFPLHAAGHHRAGSAETVLDRVMSSYASSIKTVIHSRRRRYKLATSSKALLVAMEHTPGNRTLPFSTKEVDMVWNLCGSMLLQPVRPGRRKQDIESHLRDCRIFHFAGHGTTDQYDASNSRLILEDGTLKVAELLEMSLQRQSPLLAYLAACGTGRIKDDKSVDESIHLMSAFQLAGFPHVIGTLWEVNDELCVDMARITYEGMRDGNMTDESICRGLHNASRTLRDQCLEVPPETEAIIQGSTGNEEPKGTPSGRDVVIVDALDAGLAPWAPYIHLGI